MLSRLTALVSATVTTIFLAAVFSIDAFPEKQASTVHSGTATQASAPIRFENRTAAGVNFVLNNGTTEDKTIIDSVLGGVALFDFDNDGYLDIFFTNGAGIPSLAKTNGTFYNRLYRNTGDGRFIDVTLKAGVRGDGYSMGVAAGDYNNDGYPDLYIAGLNRNTLYRNNGDGTFTDVTAIAGVSSVGPSGKKPWSVGAAWIDYDNDGLLDLLVVNYLDWSFENNKTCGEPGRRLSCSPALYSGTSNILYHNNGDGTFSDVSEQTGIGQHIGKGMGVAIADYDDDGFTDVFVANDNERNFLFRNVGGKSFVEVGVEAGVALTEDGIPASTMGVDFRDVNGDGLPDLVTTALGGETFSLRLNTGRGLFSDASFKAGLGLASATMSGWGVGAYDFDNDGFKDLFIANSHVSENVQLYSHHQYKQPNALFRNMQGKNFANVSATAGPALQAPAVHRGCAFGDLNNDGRIDVVVSVIGSPAELLFNSTAGGGHWILIQTEGTKSNRDGIGTKIRITGESGAVQYNHVTTSASYLSSVDRRVHFGLGWDATVREIQLRWPSGKVQLLKNVKADKVLKIREE